MHKGISIYKCDLKKNKAVGDGVVSVSPYYTHIAD